MLSNSRRCGNILIIMKVVETLADSLGLALNV